MPPHSTIHLNPEVTSGAGLKYVSTPVLAAFLAAFLAGLPLHNNCGAVLAHGNKCAENQLKAAPIVIHDKWAVLVGVGHYQDGSIKPIKYATRNVLTMTEASLRSTSGTFLPDHVLVATEDRVTKDAPCRLDLAGLAQQKSSAQRHDRALLLYALCPCR